MRTLCTPPNIDFKLDNIPIAYPYVPRLCEDQAHVLIWHGTAESDPDLVEFCMKGKNEPQWITCDDPDKIEKGIALIHPYDDEVIIATLKIPGYFHLRTLSQRRDYLKFMWKDVIAMFGDRRIICPSGTYFDYLHLSINQIRIPRDAYHKRIMWQNHFVRTGDYWIREPQ